MAPRRQLSPTPCHQRRQARFGFLPGRGEIFRTHGHLDNKPSLPTVCQEGETPGQRHLHKNVRKIGWNPEDVHARLLPRLFRDCSETVPRPMADHWKTRSSESDVKCWIKRPESGPGTNRNWGPCRQVNMAPCQQSVINPFENPVMPACATNDIESTGSC